jgi:uncharacterized membrane protein
MTPISQPQAASSNNQSPDSSLIQENHLNHREFLAAFFILLTLATIIFIPIFWRGFPSGMDSDRHFRWVMQFSDSLQETGVLYPRWLASANNHQGSPVTLYYPPLSFYAVAFFKLFTHDTQNALILSCWLALLLSGVTMFVFVKSICSAKLSLLAAALYMLAPYHLFDLYQGSSLAEFWAFVFVPLVLDATNRITIAQNLKPIAYLALSYALLLFTHVPISFIVTLSLPIYILLLTRNFKRLLQIASGLILGVGISAIFTASVAFERGYVPIKAVLKQDYAQYFLFNHARRAQKTTLFSQNIADFVIYTESADIRFLVYTEQIGWALLLLFIVVTAILLLNKTRFNKLSSRQSLLWATGTITALSLMMTTKFSLPLWQAIEYFRYLQFPSRWFVLTTVGLPLLIATTFSLLSADKKLQLVYRALLILAIATNLVVSAYAIGRAPYEAQAFDPTRLRRDAPEYRPVWWDKELHEEEQLSPFTIINGTAEVRVIDSEGIHQIYEVKADEEATINFRTLFFPGWVVRLDGQEKSITPSAEGRIQLKVEPGEYQLTLNFEDTRPRLVGKIISIVSLLGVIGLAMIPGRKKIQP